MKIYQSAALFILFLSIFSATVPAQKMKAEDVLAKHLDSIGAANILSKNTSRMVVGDAAVKFVSQKNLPAQGRIVLASAAKKNFWGLSLNAIDYPTERFTYDGQKVKVKYVRHSERSVLGNFVLSNNLLMEESLLGGTLSTSWALLNMPGKNAKLSFEGTKRIDGKETFVLGYSPRSSDVDVKLFFDKQTFHHVRTEYKRTFSAAMGRTIDQSARQNETRLKIVENYSDFKQEKGLTLPHNYSLSYLATGQNGTTEIEWTFKLTEFAFNLNMDEKSFDADAN